MKTISVKSPDVTRKWFVIDAKNKPLGRVAAKAAFILQGKHKPAYVPNIDNGDFVIIVNAADFILTGRKMKTKAYHHYSGYQKGLKDTMVEKMLERNPTFPMEAAVKGMLPKNRLAHKMIKKLTLLTGSEHGLKNVTVETVEI